MNKRAFTLIELLVSIALGALILGVAIAGVRVTSQSISRANRLAMENSLMRIGMQMSFNQLDLWTDCDDPCLPGSQHLRPTVVDRRNTNRIVTRGQAFTPLSETFRITGKYGPANQTSPSASVLAEGAREEASSQVSFWDPNAWHAAAQRTWSLTNLVERNVTSIANNHLMYGRYYLLSAPGWTDIPPPNHPWLARQLNGLLDALGPYGLMDYLPANVPYVTYAQPLPSRTSSPTIPWEISKVWTTGSNSVKVFGLLDMCAGSRRGVTCEDAFSLPNSDVPTNRLFVASLGYHLWDTNGTNWHEIIRDATANLKKMLADCEKTDAVLHGGIPETNQIGNKPEHWPGLEVNILRLVRDGNFVNLNRIVITDPLTGDAMQFSFTALGTTLRGARQQRAHNGGWVDPFSEMPTKNLDQ